MILLLINIFYFITGSYIEGTKSDICKVQQIGFIQEENSNRKVSSYCLEDINLDKFILLDGSLSFSKLTRNLTKTNCIWDGGTCIYQGENYYIVACQNMINGTGNVVITDNSIDYDFIYDNFCSSNLNSENLTGEE